MRCTGDRYYVYILRPGRRSISFRHQRLDRRRRRGLLFTTNPGIILLVAQWAASGDVLVGRHQQPRQGERRRVDLRLRRGGTCALRGYRRPPLALVTVTPPWFPAAAAEQKRRLKKDATASQSELQHSSMLQSQSQQQQQQSQSPQSQQSQSPQSMLMSSDMSAMGGGGRRREQLDRSSDGWMQIDEQVKSKSIDI